MKPIDMIKTATGVACVAFALNVYAQATPASDSTGMGTGTPTSNNPTPSSGMSSRPHESAGQAISDSTITTKVKAAFVAASGLKSVHIHVKTRHGVVRLTGTVPTQDQKDQADQVARGVKGVNSVTNRLKISATE